MKTDSAISVKAIFVVAYKKHTNLYFVQNGQSYPHLANFHLLLDNNTTFNSITEKVRVQVWKISN